MAKLEVTLVLVAVWGFLAVRGTLYHDCKYTASDGSVYDLSLLRAHHRGERNMATDDKGQEYFWNLCESIEDARFHTDFEKPCPRHAWVCQRTTNGNTKDCGGEEVTYSDGELGPSKGITIHMAEGDLGCNDIRRQTTIHLECGDDSEPRILEVGECHYMIEYSSRMACPKAY
mmetsp:Transcript_19685/g.55347  ORF Transcript_19685/g.55347 Transcript_19685/m.55347 type:complete len:173 (-) Transcript_19685:40-558(-)|eukprot:CAMPEP_0119129604 /NCGR_PEP_ID=MMETSP1310-20130426/7281_1 /TAXON_ID=464262 /ORGANISM="Genus nov. species nov., Strain RCC2339" /LENGTH=172 /DNA_ID=CAMNT_0007120037 /DNA_START=77 /DNA_END=598 /DNA_ORIENTATION=+